MAEMLLFDRATTEAFRPLEEAQAGCSRDPTGLVRGAHAPRGPRDGGSVPRLPSADARGRAYFAGASPRRNSSTVRTSLAVSRQRLLSAAVS